MNDEVAYPQLPRRVLVTGTSGFIGHHTQHALAGHGVETLGVDIRPPRPATRTVPHVRCDLLDRARLIETVVTFAPDAIVHLAARTDLDGDSLAAYPANTDGVANLIAALDATPSVTRCLFTSSQLVCRVGYVPSSDLDYCPDTFYGQSKVRGEQLVRAWSQSRVTWTVVRPTTIWGPGMSEHYQRFLKMIARGRYVHVSRRPLVKSYGYVGNAVHQLLRLLEVPAAAVAGKTLYLADYVPLALRDWTDQIQRELGVRPIRTVPLPIARAIARVGDGLNRVGLARFPFNSFRLRNVLTEYLFDLGPTEAVTGPLPWTMPEGVRAMIAQMRADGVV